MNLTLVINMMTAKALEFLSMPEDEFNRLNEMEMAAEIERLRHQNMLLQADVYTLRKEQHLDHLQDRLRIMEDNQAAAAREADRHISRLQGRIIELESVHAMLRGTVEHLESLMPDEPSYYTSDVPPSAPPHNERLPIGKDDE